MVADKQVLKNNMDTIKSYIKRIKLRTFDPDSPESILIDIDNSKVIMDLIKTMIIRPITLPCV